MSADHVTMGNNSLRCLHCGDEVSLPMPISMRMFEAMTRAMVEDHQNCQPSELGAARMAYSTPEDWARSWDTGTSSMAIYDYMTAGWMPREDDYPRDPADLGRCVRLLALAPEWTERLPAFAQGHKRWMAVVEHWAELVALYEEEAPTGQAPKLYARMLVLIGDA